MYTVDGTEAFPARAEVHVPSVLPVSKFFPLLWPRTAYGALKFLLGTPEVGVTGKGVGPKLCQFLRDRLAESLWVWRLWVGDFETRPHASLRKGFLEKHLMSSPVPQLSPSVKSPRVPAAEMGI